ncbi:MAG: cytochrome c oxidase subunit 3 family protein [Oceanospirillaceae bacterium]
MVKCTQSIEIMNVARVSASHQQKTLPGDFAMWAFIAMELSVFAIFFIGFAVTQRLNVEMFNFGRASLNMSVGLFCTLSLIISSYFVALAVKSVKEANNLRAMRMLILSLLTASAYLVLKLSEYTALAQLGYGLSSNSFYTLYFFITGFHFMHVLLGMIILTYMAIKAKNKRYLADDCSGFEAGAAYWHMIDLVWVIIFFLIYIIH